jgi:hypothetical protein
MSDKAFIPLGLVLENIPFIFFSLKLHKSKQGCKKQFYRYYSDTPTQHMVVGQVPQYNILYFIIRLALLK